ASRQTVHSSAEKIAEGELFRRSEPAFLFRKAGNAYAGISLHAMQQTHAFDSIRKSQVFISPQEKRTG
ncbi:MAG: hypothetical protein IKU70_01555, partial [Clostridia bacterium]|nr:hypothetical protein [Clostridia bacterium]